MRQHFEETVKPGKKVIIIDGKIKAFFKEPALWKHFHFDLVLKSRRGLVNASCNRHTYMLKQHLYSLVIHCKWPSMLNRGTTVYEYIFSEICSYIDSVGVDFDEDDDNSIDLPHKHKPQPCMA